MSTVALIFVEEYLSTSYTDAQWGEVDRGDIPAGSSLAMAPRGMVTASPVFDITMPLI